jgi:hypothetical protein
MGDLVMLRADLGEPRHVIIAEISEDGYIRVLMDGRLVWMPKSFVVRDVVPAEPVQPDPAVV